MAHSGLCLQNFTNGQSINGLSSSYDKSCISLCFFFFFAKRILLEFLCADYDIFCIMQHSTLFPADHFCPRNLAVEHLTSHSVNLFWFQGSNCPPRPSFEIIYNYSSHHHMFKRIEAAGEENLTKMTTSIDQLLPGTEYLFRVTAEDKTGGVSTLNISCPTASVVVTTGRPQCLGYKH